MGCPRPLSGVHYVMRCVCPPGGVVVDPFAGACTVAVAGVQNGRQTVCVEQSREYWAKSCDRVSSAAGAPRRDVIADDTALPLFDGVEE